MKKLLPLLAIASISFVACNSGDSSAKTSDSTAVVAPATVDSATTSTTTVTDSSTTMTQHDTMPAKKIEPAMKMKDMKMKK